jgi:DNA polymerase III subunit gamma/tau
MGQALYREYRSKTFEDVIGQDHITKVLKNAIKSGKVSHAYLFTGPRGVGKTSVARILAREVNGLKYAEETIHLDIIEIDAASNRRIDEIRELRDKVHIAPTSVKYKVYIIDEVHMLTREAFNALLKTLEEPPAHCIFILATTEAHKVPETIVSRTQKHNFKPITQKNLTNRLGEIAKKESIDITEEALDLLAAQSGGSFRDSISMLDQLSSSGGKVDAQEVRLILGLPADTQVTKLLESVQAGDTQQIIKTLDELSEMSINPVEVAKSMNHIIRQNIVAGGSQDWQVGLLKELLDVSGQGDLQSRLEIALLQVASSNNSPTPIKNSGKAFAPVEPVSAAEVDVVQSTASAEEEIVIKSEEPAKAETFDMALWPQVVSKIKTEAASLYTALRLAEPSLDGDTLTLAFQFPLHQKKVNVAKAKDTLAKIIEEVSGAKLAINCVVEKKHFSEPDRITNLSTDSDQPELQSISNIFGAAEVLES